MKKTFKTLLALLMALALVAALFVPVWATEPEETTEAPEETTEAPEETEAPAEETTEAPAEETTEAPAEETTEAPAEETTEAPAEETTAAPAASEGDEETTEAPAEETTEAPAEETTAAPAEETTEEPAEETTEEAETVEGIYAIIAYAEENGYVYVADVLTGFWAYFVPSVITPYGPNWIWNTCFDGDVYGARHELGVLYFAECADVRWTIIDETNGGRLYNNYRASQHHNRTASIYWTGLDLDGKHPAGAWNNPTKVHFTLWIYVVDINGVEHPMFYSFDYYFIDCEGAANCDACNPTPAAGCNACSTAPANSDVPHTGL